MIYRRFRRLKMISLLFSLFLFVLFTSLNVFALRPPSAASKIRDLCTEFANSPPPRRSLLLPGVHDALSAKIFSDHSPVLFLSGFGASASRLGAPDAGILTLSEMEDAARCAVAAAGRTPVIADGDTGHGGLSNVRRTVRGLARAGCGGVSVEDQEFPKRCTFAAGGGVRVVSRDESLRRIRAALAARDEALEVDGNEILVVARTDCRAALGYREAVERCLLFRDAGADIVYAENLRNGEEYVKLREEMEGDTPMMMAQLQLHGTEGGPQDQALYDSLDIGEMGYALALYGVTALQATISALQSTAKEFESGNGIIRSDQTRVSLSTFDNVKTTVGFPELNEFEKNI
mmetsp:Transcript_48760/g.95320  ORF Transcript_48760/g.95320 Transcript_48760/m.95320 type:complete len:347 (+) Transcript_48760:382-1422(+)